MKKLLSFLLIACFLLSAAGCTVSPPDTDEPPTPLAPNTQTPDAQPPKESMIPEHQDLNIVCNDTNKEYVEYLVNSFTNKYYDVDIEITYIEGVGSDTYGQKLASLILSGDGPDIMLVGTPCLITSDADIILSDVSLDINVLNDKYDYLNWSDYEENIICAGVIDGQRKFLPAYYDFQLLIGVKETLDTYDVEYGDGVTFFDFANSGSGSEKLLLWNPIVPGYMYRYLGFELIDPNTGEVHLMDDTFRTFVQAYNTLYPEIYNGKYRDYVGSGNYRNGRLDPLLAEDVLFMNAGTSHMNINYSYISVWDSIVQGIIDAEKTPVLTTIPNLDGSDTVYGTLGWSLAINSATKSEEAALRLLAHSVSFEFYAKDQKFRGIPVNEQYNAAVKAMYYGEDIALPEGYKLKDFLYGYDELNKNILDQYYDIVSRVVMPKYTDNDSLIPMNNIFTDIQKNGMDMDQAIAKAQDATKIQLSK